MEIIVITCIVLGLIGGVLYLTFFFLPALIYAFVGTACGLGSLFLFLYLVCLMRWRSLCSREGFAKVVRLDFDGRQLSWTPDEGLVRANAAPGPTYHCGVVIGCTCAAALSLALTTIGNPHVGPVLANDEELVRGAGMLIAVAVSLIALMKVIERLKPKEVFETWMVKLARSICSPGERQARRIEELLSMESSIHSLSGDIGVNFPIDISQEVETFIDSHKAEILHDPERLNEFISERIKESQADLSELEKAREIYLKALAVHDEAAHEVTKAGSVPLLRELDQIYTGLASADLKSLVPARRWSEFAEVLNAMIDDLNRLSGLALRYQKEGCEKPSPDGETLTEGERACQILGVSATASPEQIKSMFHLLAQIWHGDKDEKMLQDDKRVKDIIWAYNFLKDLKQFK